MQDALLRVEGPGARPEGSSTDVVVARRNGLALTLGDLGTLVEREREPDSLARINGQRADQLQRLQAAGRQHRGHRRRA